MDLRMQNHRMTCWLGRFVAALLLVLFATAFPAQAAVESVAPVSDGGIWLFYDPDNRSPQTLSPDVACNSGYNLYWAGPNGFTYLGSIPNQYGYAGLGWRDCKFLDTKQGMIAYLGSIKREPYPPNCPIPTVNPTVLYVYNVLNNMCERDVPCIAPNVLNPDGQCKPPGNLIITIEPSGTYLPTNGTYTILPSTALPLYAVVKNQNGVVQAGKQVSLTVSVQTDTNGVPDGNGGHLHTANRPQGKFACSSVYDPGATSATCTLTTDNNGQAPFIFLPTAVSGAHTITGTCTGCSSTATAPVNVKVDNLITIPASPLYALSDSKGVIGAIPEKHTDNHYLTATALSKLNDLATLYTTKVDPKAILYLNDASLVWGGLFDVGNTPWSRPHAAHQTGTSLDIRAANSGPNNEGAVPATLFKKFIDEAQKKNFRIGLHCSTSDVTQKCLNIPEFRHIHVDF